MNYKIEGAIRRNRSKFIICLILWLILVIVFVAPFTYSSYKASVNGNFSFEIFLDTFVNSVTAPFTSFGNIFAYSLFSEFISTLLPFTIIYLIFFFIGFFKSAPKNEFTDFEHGSSDWSQRGEQYQILSKNKGILLAQNNYLPLDKRGNVNVLVVGRIRIW